MECKSCKHYIECLNEANKRGEIFDPEYDGEHRCGANSFEKISNRDRIRAMTDDELAAFICCTGWRLSERKECLEWLQQEADEINI